MTDEEYPPGDLEDEHVLRRIKKNDPSITCMQFDFTYSEGFVGQERHYFATTVDWDKEEWSFFENPHLTCITIDIYIRDNENKSKNAKAKDRENLCSFARAIAHNRSIREIRFDVSDSLGDECIIGDIFTNLSPMLGRLHRIELVNTDLDDNSIQKLKDALEACGQSELQEFYLAYTTNEQAGIIIDAINGHCNKLKKLVWGSDNGEGLFGGSSGFLALSNLVSNPSSALEMLDLGYDYDDEWDEGNDGDFDSTSVFATALANNSTLKFINFGGCSNVFSTNEWQTMLSILRHNSIKELHLFGQWIGVEGISSIVQGLSNNTSLSELDLRRCSGVTSAGWNELSITALPLERLHISNSVLRGEVAVSIASILIDNKSLKELTLEGEWDIRDEVLIELSNALANNDALKILNLGHIDRATAGRINAQPSDGIKAISRILCDQSSIDATFHSNHTLDHVSLRVLGLDDHYRSVVLPSHLTDMLQLNKSDNKFDVSRQKILRCHFDGYDTQKFVDMELEELPYALAWCSGDYRGPSLLYCLMQSQPSLFDSNSKRNKAAVVAEKRKRNE